MLATSMIALKCVARPPSTPPPFYPPLPSPVPTLPVRTHACIVAYALLAGRYAPMGLLIVVRNVGPLIALPVERVFNEPIPVDPWSYMSLAYILVGVCLYVGALLELQKDSMGGRDLVIGLALMVRALPTSRASSARTRTHVHTHTRCSF